MSVRIWEISVVTRVEKVSGAWTKAQAVSGRMGVQHGWPVLALDSQSCLSDGFVWSVVAGDTWDRV